MEAIADRFSSEEGVNVLLIHSVITSRFSSSRASCTMYRNDQDRELTAIAKFRTASVARCVHAVAIVSTAEPFESS